MFATSQVLAGSASCCCSGGGVGVSKGAFCAAESLEQQQLWTINRIAPPLPRLSQELTRRPISTAPLLKGASGCGQVCGREKRSAASPEQPDAAWTPGPAALLPGSSNQSSLASGTGNGRSEGGRERDAYWWCCQDLSSTCPFHAFCLFLRSDSMYVCNNNNST